MKLYRDMSPEQRALADRWHEKFLLEEKKAAEHEMMQFDRLTPKQRREERNEEFERFYDY